MTFDQALGAAGLVVGVVGIVLAVIFYRRTVRTKLLAIGVTSPSPLVFTTQDIVVDYMGHSIKALSRSYILFWNRGTAAIEHSDFLEPIKFSADAPMLTMEILDRDVASQVSLDRD